ncbi:hypothetical protein LHYA1_G009232 [Lachnellula hyalina]|uniref:Nitrogen regulatory protein areA GATA-like domain-containing protein n=1 Tax=Lachnellula hyalina TaxID=1316788 RepID=A0A8H8TUB4_9HELO|nr:uncharacterized protein LHYA1_G009232 [Lachnellula hyalina]TVY22107.1 hypothetical protein LHYA1_G009232 [Lachnellula hyalina]
MPSRLDAPVLTVDVGLIHKVDTRNVENLFSMWTVFSRCAASLEQGRRLENLSWRLWNRETFCCDPISEANATTPATSIASRSPDGRYSSNEVPSLSGSLDSLPDEEALEFDDSTLASDAAPLSILHPQIYRQDSVSSRSRGRERHITPDDLEKMVLNIKSQKNIEPLSISTHSYLAPVAPIIAPPQPRPKQISAPAPKISIPSVQNNLAEPAPDNSAESTNSDGVSCTSERSTTSVVKGFSPSHVSSSYRSIPLLNTPASIPEVDLAAITASNPVRGPQPKKQTMFALGGSSAEDSTSEQNNSMENSLKPILKPKKKSAMFSFGGSSNEDESSLPAKINKSQSALANGLQRPLPAKKQTSFKEEVATRTIQEEQPFDDDVFETDEEDDIDESAIDDDDDSSDWEDSVEGSGNASIDERTFFQRVDSKANLTSRRSLITTMLHQSDRANALAQAAATTSRSTPALQRSRTTSPNGPSFAASPDSDDASPLMMKRGLKPIAEIPQAARTSAQPIIQTTTNITPHQQALSPRTTRRKMIYDELTVSLRQHLVHEHRQKSQTANAVLKRRHTTQDVANLKQYPEKVHMESKDGDAVNASWNQYFEGGLGEYHSKGW